jgi:hypothetical protein
MSSRLYETVRHGPSHGRFAEYKEWMNDGNTWATDRVDETMFVKYETLLVYFFTMCCDNPSHPEPSTPTSLARTKIVMRPSSVFSAETP